jgi:hypothetical protein
VSCDREGCRLAGRVAASEPCLATAASGSGNCCSRSVVVVVVVVVVVGVVVVDLLLCVCLLCLSDSDLVPPNRWPWIAGLYQVPCGR